MSKLTILKHIIEGARGAKDYTRGLVSELSGLVTAALEEMDAGKQDKPDAGTAVIPASGWSGDSTAGYPNYYDIPAAGVTASDRAEVTVVPESMAAASACGLCPVNESLAGKIRVRAASVPAAQISIEYRVEKGSA